MKVSKIKNAIINRAIYINGKWKLSVIIDEELFPFTIKADELITDEDLVDLLYTQMEVYEDVVTEPPTPMTTKESIVNSKVTKKIKK